MVTGHRAAAVPRDDERAERILATARELLLAWGYKRVTVDEIARRAQIGKGTVYLHWRTKNLLFAELLRRELNDVIGALAAGIEQDPSAALAGAFVREFFLQHVRSPLALAVRASDGDILGALSTPASGLPLAQELGLHTLLGGLVEVWRTHGLVTTTVPAADQVYTIDAVLTGFFSGGVAGSPDEDVSPERRADLLDRVIGAATEPPTLPPAATLRAAAQDVLALLANTRRSLTGTRY